MEVPPTLGGAIDAAIAVRKGKWARLIEVEELTPTPRWPAVHAAIVASHTALVKKLEMGKAERAEEGITSIDPIFSISFADPPLKFTDTTCIPLIKEYAEKHGLVAEMSIPGTPTKITFCTIAEHEKREKKAEEKKKAVFEALARKLVDDVEKAEAQIVRTKELYEAQLANEEKKLADAKMRLTNGG